jgi:hypothetical protein
MIGQQSGPMKAISRPISKEQQVKKMRKFAVRDIGAYLGRIRNGKHIKYKNHGSLK